MPFSFVIRYFADLWMMAMREEMVEGLPVESLPASPALHILD